MPHHRDRGGQPGDCRSVRDRQRASAGPAAGCRTALRGGAEDRPEPAYLYSMRRWRPPMERCEYSAGRSPCECLGSPKLLTFRSGQGHASRGRLRREQIEPSAHSMPGSGSPARDAGPSEHGVRAGTPPRESAFPCQHGRRGSARGRIRRPVSREASHSPAIAKIIRSFGSPFGSLTTISSSEKQWAQQGSNLRPLACKASALPLSYAPVRAARAATGDDPGQRTSPARVTAAADRKSTRLNSSHSVTSRMPSSA